MSEKKTTAMVHEAAPVAQIVLDPQALIQQAIEHNSGIETLERLVALAKDVQAQRARQAWYGAMAEFQRTCPPIKKTSTANIQTSKGRFSYSWAELEEIMRAISPVMGPLGLSVSYRTRAEGDKVFAVARVSHEMGHSEESGEVPMPVAQMQEGMGAGAQQRVGIALTYAKRYALLAIIGLAPEKETAAGGGPSVAMPSRSGAAPAEPGSDDGPEPAAPNVWVGVVKSIREKTGKRADGTEWLLYTLVGADGMELGTFDKTLASFARESMGERVRVPWTMTQKGGRSATGIEATDV
jgi:hypothetical protein